MLMKKDFLDDYIVYSNGSIYNKRLKRFQAIEKTKITDRRKKHYHRVSIKRKHYQVHRLVAMCFIPNPDNKPCVNHIDGNTENNNVSNLEWCSYSENELHSYRALGKKPNPNMKGRIGKNSPFSIPIVAVDIVTNQKIFFDASKDAERAGFNQGLISECLRKKRIKHKGYYWFYKKDYDNNNIQLKERKTKKMPVVAIGKDGKKLFFNSITEAKKQLNMAGNNIQKAINSNGNCYGYKWAYIKHKLNGEQE